jgi:putative oxidoreductase
MERLSRYGILIARVMISMVFLLNALGVIDQAEAARELAARGAPSNLVPFLMLVGRSVELIGGLALAFGVFQMVAAVALIAFLVAATFVGHAFWLAAAGTPVFVGQLINFLKNLAIMGGLLFVASTQSQLALMRSTYARKASGSLDEIASHSKTVTDSLSQGTEVSEHPAKMPAP